MTAIEKLKALSTVTVFWGNEANVQKDIDQLETIGALYCVIDPDGFKLGKNAIIFTG